MSISSLERRDFESEGLVRNKHIRDADEETICCLSIAQTIKLSIGDINV
jgi:hypothetical protein